jgi:hypothetical protein
MTYQTLSLLGTYLSAGGCLALPNPYFQFMPTFVLVFTFSVDAHKEQYSNIFFNTMIFSLHVKNVEY